MNLYSSLYPGNVANSIFLVKHINFQQIAFTGSTATGSKIMTAAAQLVKVCLDYILTVVLIWQTCGFLYFLLFFFFLFFFSSFYLAFYLTVLTFFSFFYLLVVDWQPVTLELGGKSPILVFEDVDLDKGLCLLKYNFKLNNIFHSIKRPTLLKDQTCRIWI